MSRTWAISKHWFYWISATDTPDFRLLKEGITEINQFCHNIQKEQQGCHHKHILRTISGKHKSCGANLGPQVSLAPDIAMTWEN